MSVVTTVVLSIAALESTRTIDALQQALRKRGIGELGDLSEAWSDGPERGRRWGGDKFPEVSLYGAAYNHLDLKKLMNVLLGAPWDEPEDLQLWICEQEDSKFTVYEVIDGTWQALRPPRRAPST